MLGHSNKSRSSDELRKLISDLNQNTKSLNELGLPIKYWNVIIIDLALRRWDQDLRENWCRLSKRDA